MKVVLLLWNKKIFLPEWTGWVCKMNEETHDFGLSEQS